MTIITISRGSYSRGKEVAEQVARQLGYELVAREVLIEASQEFNVDEVKLVRAVSNAPSLFSRLSYAKERYIAFIRAALLDHLKKDNIVYHGMAGHFFVRDVAHALKVRIIADMEDRVQLVMKRDGISRKAAQRFIERIDKERSKWSQQLYGIDSADPKLYDLVIHIKKIQVECAVDIICHTARLERFQASEESRRMLEDDALAAHVKAVLVKDHPEAEVSAQDGVVHVTAKATEAEELHLAEKIKELVRQVPGVKEVETHLHWFTPFGT